MRPPFADNAHMAVATADVEVAGEVMAADEEAVTPAEEEATVAAAEEVAAGAGAAVVTAAATEAVAMVAGKEVAAPGVAAAATVRFPVLARAQSHGPLLLRVRNGVCVWGTEGVPYPYRMCAGVCGWRAI